MGGHVGVTVYLQEQLEFTLENPVLEAPSWPPPTTCRIALAVSVKA